MSTIDITSRDCTTPGCPGDAHRNVAGLPFCRRCLAAEPHRVLKAMAQRAEMRRQADIAVERESRRRTDELAEKRLQREREAVRAREFAAQAAVVTPRQLDGRTRAVLTLQRLRSGAQRRKDDTLERALAAAIDALAAELVAPSRRTA